MKVAIIGAGNMGGATARGLAQGTVILASDITVSNPSAGKLDALKKDFPEMNVCHDNTECVQGADMVILAVKPWKIKEVVDEIRPSLVPGRTIVASMAGGIGINDIDGMLTDGNDPVAHSPIYRIIPNTAIAVRQSMTFLSSLHTTADMDQTVLKMFSELGDAMLVEERLMGAGMALASCGIAYAFRYIRAAMEGGVELGLYPRDAQRIVQQTLVGAVAVLEASGAHPEAEVDRVTTPGGFTIRGLNEMEKNGFTTAVIEGLKASVK